MNKYSKEDLKIFKRVIKDYNIIKKEIDKRIKKGYTIEDLLDYIRHLSACDITNCDLIDAYKYIDFNYCDMCISILEHDKNGVYLGESIEVYDNNGMYLDMFNNVRELESIIKEL